MYENEIAKEYMRNAFHQSLLDVTDSFECIKGFVEIFAGEMEPLIAISHCTFLSKEELHILMDIAKPTKLSTAHYQDWLDQIHAPIPYDQEGPI